MAEIVEAVMDKLSGLPVAGSMDDVFAADEKARQMAAGLIR
jgi:1-deoxy-D-xylulose-5-phosphate reductoisomerase